MVVGQQGEGTARESQDVKNGRSTWSYLVTKHVSNSANKVGNRQGVRVLEGFKVHLDAADDRVGAVKPAEVFREFVDLGISEVVQVLSAATPNAGRNRKGRQKQGRIGGERKQGASSRHIHTAYSGWGTSTSSVSIHHHQQCDQNEDQTQA